MVYVYIVKERMKDDNAWITGEWAFSSQAKAQEFVNRKDHKQSNYDIQKMRLN